MATPSSSPTPREPDLTLFIQNLEEYNKTQQEGYDGTRRYLHVDLENNSLKLTSTESEASSLEEISDLFEKISKMPLSTLNEYELPQFKHVLETTLRTYIIKRQDFLNSLAKGLTTMSLGAEEVKRELRESKAQGTSEVSELKDTTGELKIEKKEAKLIATEDLIEASINKMIASVKKAMRSPEKARFLFYKMLELENPAPPAKDPEEAKISPLEKSFRQKAAEKFTNPHNRVLIEKQEMANVYFDPEVSYTLQAQQQEYPIVQKAISALKENYAQWTSNTPEAELLLLKETIKRQVANLIRLSKELSKIDSPKEISKMPINPELMKLLGPAIKGYKLSEEQWKNLKITIENHAKKTSETTIALETPQTLAERRKASPITKTAILGQSSAFKAARIAREQASRGLIPRPMGTSLNSVYLFSDETKTASETSSAFFKRGQDGSDSTGLMEKFIWDAACIMGKEKSFAGTKQTSLQSLSNPDLQGSVQPKLSGIKFAINQDSETPIEISKKQLTDGLVTASFFGMFDLHGNNVIISPEGDIQFFDNTCCLPHSNSVITTGSVLRPSFRCCLLQHKKCRAPLSAEDREYLKHQVKDLRSNYSTMKRFIEESSIDKRLEEGWLNKIKALSALEERLTRMEKALTKTPPVQTLEEFIYDVIPDFKFFSILALIERAKHEFSDSPEFYTSLSSLEYFQNAAGNFAGAGSIDETIKKVAEMGIDPYKLKSFCDDEEQSIENVLKYVQKEMLSLSSKTIEVESKTPKEPSEVQKENKASDSAYIMACRKNAKKLITKFQQKAEFDAKDLPRGAVMEEAYLNILKIADNLGMSITTNIPAEIRDDVPFILCPPLLAPSNSSYQFETKENKEEVKESKETNNLVSPTEATFPKETVLDLDDFMAFLEGDVKKDPLKETSNAPEGAGGSPVPILKESTNESQEVQPAPSLSDLPNNAFLESKTRTIGATPEEFSKDVEPKRLFYCYKHRGELIQKEIDYKTVLGKFTIDGINIENLELLSHPPV